VKLALLGLLAGCQRLAPFDSGTELFVETLEPDAVHLLATSLPSFDDDPTLLELDLALEPTWSFHREAGGAQGAWRVEDGDTVLAAVTMPPDFSSSIMRIDPQGALVWDHPGLFLAGLGFAHGVVATPEGDWIALDTTGGRLVSFTEEGQELWSYAFDQHGEPGSPNGVAIHRHPEQGALLAVSLLARSSAAGSQQLALLEDPGSRRWSAGAWRCRSGRARPFPTDRASPRRGSCCFASPPWGRSWGWTSTGRSAGASPPRSGPRPWPSLGMPGSCPTAAWWWPTVRWSCCGCTIPKAPSSWWGRPRSPRSSPSTP
jgi:hypothetical protein